MKKMSATLYPWLFLCFVMPRFCYAQSESNNISISGKTETYEFVKGSILNPVQVKESISTTFKCNGYRTVIPFVEFYDDNTSIDDIKMHRHQPRAGFVRCIG